MGGWGEGNDGHVSALLPIANAEGGIEGGSLIGTRCKSPCHSSSSPLMREEATGAGAWRCRAAGEHHTNGLLVARHKAFVTNRS